MIYLLQVQIQTNYFKTKKKKKKSLQNILNCQYNYLELLVQYKVDCQK